MATTVFQLARVQIVGVRMAVTGINPLLKLIASTWLSPTVISLGCGKFNVCFFFPVSDGDVAVAVGVGVGTRATTRTEIVKLLAW